MTGSIKQPLPALWLLMVLLLAWLPITFLSAAQINLQVLPDQVRANESFRLIYTATGSVDEEPDFSALTTDFEILTNQSSSSISLINGDYSRSKTWTLDLMARREGNLVIPPIPFGRDLSPAKAVAVVESSTPRPGNAQQTADIFIDVGFEPRSPYVQQQVVLKVKLYRAINVSSATLSEPTGGGDLIVEKLGEDRSYPANQGGKRYMVVERNYALLPQASGEVAIDPLQFEGQIASARQFGFDPFGGGQRVRVQSDPVTISVRPVPPNFRGDHWLPAKNLSLTAEWSEPQPEFRVGEPVTRIIRLTAEGLAASQLPEINLTLPDGVRSYRDQPQLQASVKGNGIIAQREEKIALIPQQPGILKLPSIEIPWWNTASDQLETATLPAVEIAVLPALTGTTGNNPLPLRNTPLLATPKLAELDQGIGPTAPPALAGQRWLPWVIAGVFGFGWMITAYLWRRDRHSGGKGDLANQKNPLPDLRLACNSHDRQHAAKALLRWGKQRYPDQPPPSLEALARQEHSPLAELISELAKALYAASASPWQGGPLWSAVKSAKKPENGVRKSAGPALQSLNPE